MTQPLDLTKQSPIGDWEVHEYVGGKYNRWRCRCICGVVRDVIGGQLRSGRSLGCGCRKKEKIGKKNRKHGHSDGGVTSITYQSWRSMLARCLNPNNPRYHLYGAIGVTVHPKWVESFETFLHDVGERPSADYTLDRHPDGAGSYVPGNVRWATASEQNNNRPGYNHLVTTLSKTLTLSEWAKTTGLPRSAIKMRLKRGWTPNRAVTEPVDPKHQSRKKIPPSP